ncbi:MAG: galactose-1-phosphate uridylyltransferase [Candidatus Geothermincolia bacterium]
MRQDPLTGRWVVIATERGKRPESFTHVPDRRVEPTGDCPFCPGNEALTPPEVYAEAGEGRLPDAAGWRVRVVPNKYPAFTADGEVKPACDGLYCSFDGVGFHEVIIHSVDHHRSWAQMNRAELASVLRAYRERYRAHCEDPRIRYIHFIENHGREAGASIEHPHSQLFALPLVPPVLEEELRGLRAYRESEGGCLLCAMVRSEEAGGTRMVGERGGFVAFEPYASRVPFETWVTSRSHLSSLEDLSEAALADLSELLGETLRRVFHALNDPPYNLILHTAPCDGAQAGLFHLHFELWPKLSLPAGFEWGTGMMINTALPEECATFLRGAHA